MPAIGDFNLTRPNQVDYSLSGIGQKRVQAVDSVEGCFSVFLRKLLVVFTTAIRGPALFPADDYSAFSTR